jgi:hypothetical protein
MFTRTLSIASSLCLSKIIYSQTLCEYDDKLMLKMNGSIISVSKFNKLFPNYSPVMFNSYNYHNKYGYKFSETKHFIDETNLIDYLGVYEINDISIIKYLDDEIIYIEGLECRTNEFKIIKTMSINEYVNNLTFDNKINMVKQNGKLIKYIKNPDKYVQLEAVKQDGYAIEYIENPNKSVQLEAVKQNGHAIRHIKNPDKDVQLEAVKQNGYAICNIKNPDKDVKLEAVKQNGYVINYIENPDEDVQLKAVKQIGYAIKYIKTPYEDVVKEALK